MQNSVIVRKFAGQVIPDDFANKVLESYQGTWGAAFLTEDNKISMAAQDQPLSKEQFDELNLHFMDKEFCLFLSQAHEIQPYSIIEVGGNFKLLCFLEGNFKRMLNDGDTLSNENAIIDKWMKPRLQKIYGFLNGDMSKIRAEIEEDSTTQDFMNMIEDRGTFVLWFPDGPYTISKGNPAAGSWEWGTSSNHLGFGAKVEELPLFKTAGVLSLFKGGVSAAAAAVGLAPPPPPKKETAQAPLAAKPVAAPPPPPPRKEQAAAASPPPPPKKPETVPAVPFPKGAVDPQTLASAKASVGATEVVYYKANDKISNSRKKDIYKLAKVSLDFVPDWRQCPVVEIDKERWEKYSKSLLADGSLVDFNTMAEELKAKFNTPKPGEIKVTSQSADGTVTSQTVKTPPAPPPPPKKDTVEHIPSAILPADRRKEILAQDMAVLDKSSIDIGDPSKLGELVKKFPPLETQLGKDQFWRKWGVDSLKQWVTKNPDAAAIIVFHQNIRLAQFEAATKQAQSEQHRKAAGIKK